MFVWFVGNQIGIEGARAIAEGLKVNKTVHAINLSCKWFYVVFDQLKWHMKLFWIWLIWLLLWLLFVSIVIECEMKLNKRIDDYVYVLFVDNQIGVHGALAIAEALHVNKTLREIMFYGTWF